MGDRQETASDLAGSDGAEEARVIDLLSSEVAECRQTIQGLESVLSARDRSLIRLRDLLQEERLHRIWLDGEVARRDAELGRLRAASGAGRRRRLAGWLAPPGGRRRRWLAKLAGVLGRRGRKAPHGPPAPLDPVDGPPATAGSASARSPAPSPEFSGSLEEPGSFPLAQTGGRPRFSILFWADGRNAEGTLASLRAQSYTAWDVCPMEDQAQGRPVAVGGDYLIPLEPGDLLEPDCLRALAERIEREGEPDLISWDEGEAGDETGQADRLKPGWSPELLLSGMYLGRAYGIRRDRFDWLGGFRAGFGAARHHDLALRLAEGPWRAVHWPRRLSRRRPEPDPMPAFEIERGARAVAEALARRGLVGRVSRPEFAIREGRAVFQIDFPDQGPGVAVVIPTRDRVDLLRRCVGSILERTTYRDFRVVVVDNESVDPEALSYLEDLPARDGRCEVVRIANEGGRFSYARVNNRAISGLSRRDEFVVFLNNDTEVRRPEWLSQMVGYGRMPGVGAVGARLLFPDGRVQHGGMVLGLEGGLPGHAFKLAPWWERGHLDHAVVARNCSALTAACLLTRRSLFESVGGFDEDRFGVAFNDVDYCLRLATMGLRCVYAPRAELLHYEGATRGFGDSPTETEAYRSAWGGLAELYVNPDLMRSGERLARGL